MGRRSFPTPHMMAASQNVSVQWQEAKPEGGLLNAGLLFRAAIALFIAYGVSGLVYNVYFHPLKNIPGPFWARASLIWRFYHCVAGRWHLVLQEAHKRYGDVLRVSPNELSFASASAYKAIYGGQKTAPLVKSEFYDMIGLGFDEGSMGSERNPHAALQKRELFAEAFADRNLAKQEATMQKLADFLVAKIAKLGNTAQGMDMDKWLVYFAFDLTGEMAFGESFACMEKENAHEWLELIMPLFFLINIADNLRRLPLAVTLASRIPTKWTNGIRNKIVKYSKDQTAKRLRREGRQDDFFDNVSNKVRKGEVSEEQMAAHLFTLSVAAGETAATAMTGLMYYLLTNLQTLQQLQREVRGAYKNAHEIDIASTLKFPYLQAVLKEAMRIFPVVPQGLPRISPGAVIEGHYVPKGTEVYVSGWSVTHDERYFHEPYTFKPERWIDPQCQDVKQASQPFSLGPRVCPGKRFAYSQMSIELAKMVYNYDMELVESSRNWREDCRVHFFWWKPALNVRFRPREDMLS